jgi:hypothetical protein
LKNGILDLSQVNFASVGYQSFSSIHWLQEIYFNQLFHFQIKVLVQLIGLKTVEFTKKYHHLNFLDLHLGDPIHLLILFFIMLIH